MNTEFKNLDDLYNRIKPALYSKVMELKRNHISYVKESDIWNYLSKNVWSKKENLSLTTFLLPSKKQPPQMVRLFFL